MSPPPSSVSVSRGGVWRWLLASAMAAAHCHGLLIDEYGAVPGNQSFAAARANSEAILHAFEAANQLEDRGDRVVEIPAGASYTVLNCTMEALQGVTLQLDGTLLVYDDLDAWPVDGSVSDFVILAFYNCSDLVVTGDGLIDGQGWNFWVATLFGRSHGSRPTLLYMDLCQDVLVNNIRLQNGPRFHVKAERMSRLVVHGVDIAVDWRRQRDLLGEHGLLSDQGLPMFPFNTDGIDPSGEDVHIYNCTIENWDDAVAVKPASNKTGLGPFCSQHMLVEDLTIRYGVGMSIGSVSPNAHANCINNVTFRNIDFTFPMKAIYVKPNPGDSGTASISNIRYENVMIRSPVWYGIYLGPQQMREPDGGGTGCMLYPLGGDDYCPTDPLVTISNISLVNVTQSGGVFPPLMRCNETNPCTGFHFENVQINDGPGDRGWICENVQGTEDGGTLPSTGCLTSMA